MNKLLLSMPDLHCASCERLVRTSIGAKQGIQSVSISLENKEVEVSYNPAEISSGMIIALLQEGTGYSVQEKIAENEIAPQSVVVENETINSEVVKQEDNAVILPSVSDESDESISSSVNINQLITYSAGSIVSKTVKTLGKANVTLFSMGAGTEIEDHTSTRNGIVHILEGEGVFALEGKSLEMKSGEMIFMPKNSVHSLKAKENTSFLLILTD